MDKKLLKQIKEKIRADVATIFSSEDISTQQKALEELLEESALRMADLVDQSSAKEVEVAEKVSEIETLTTKVDVLMKEVEAIKSESTKASKALSDVTAERDALKSQMDEINKQLIMDNRVKDLESAGVLRSGEAADKQKAYIGKLSDEEFADYREHLVETKTDLETAIKAALASSSSDTTDGKDTASATAPVVSGKELAAINSTVKLTKEDKEKYASLFK